MRGRFLYLRFNTFPMTPRTPQCEVFWALLSNSKHSGVPEDSKSPTLEVLGFTPHLAKVGLRYSAAHKVAVSGVAHLRKQQTNQAKPNDEQIVDIIEMERGKHVKECLLNREGLKMILSVILWLARQGLPLRGHREQDDSPSNNRGNFLELLQFKLEDDAEKKRWFDNLSENLTYVSPPMQNVFIQIIADQVRAAVLQELNDGDPD